jgi:hypothetical protein
MFDFIGDFAHGRQSDFGNDLAYEIRGRGWDSGASPELERPRALIRGVIQYG